MTILLLDGTEINHVGRIVPVEGMTQVICWDTDGKRIVPSPDLAQVESIVCDRKLSF